MTGRRPLIPLRELLLRIDQRVLLIAAAVLVGMSSGLAALLLNRGIEAIDEGLDLVRHQWWALLLPGVGAALGVLFLHRVVREPPGHGVPEVILSVSRRGGALPTSASFSRLVAACLTIGSGGSAGPEAPVVVSGSAIGSTVGRALAIPERQRVVLVGCGSAAAIAAIFNAPIAGIIFTLEVILGEWTAVNIVPIAIAAVAGTALSRVLNGNQIPFPHTEFVIGLGDLGASLGLAALAAVVSILLTKLLRESHRAWHRLHVPDWVRAGVGGCTVGAIGLLLPVVLGEGYRAVREMIGSHFSQGLALVALVLVAKLVATSITLGSGGAGGIFAPSLVIGSLVGVTYHRALTTLLPGLPLESEGCYALVGMAGLISGMLQAPLTGIFLIIEITGGQAVILPLIVVATVASTVAHRLEPTTFYLDDLIRRGQLLRPGTDARVLADLRVEELLERDCATVSEGMRLRELVEVVKTSRRNYFPVLAAKTSEFSGLIHLDDLRPYLFSPELYDAVVAGEIMDPSPLVVHPDDDLNQVLDRMDSLGRFSMPVVDGGRFLGMISKATLLDCYRRELIVQTDHPPVL
jgi:CIC family chloride channel protein